MDGPSDWYISTTCLLALIIFRFVKISLCCKNLKFLMALYLTFKKVFERAMHTNVFT